MILRAADVARVERIAARVNAAVAGPLAELAPDLAPAAAPLAGGQVVLLGPGMYVNRGLAMGLGTETTTDDLEALEAASGAAVDPTEVEFHRAPARGRGLQRALIGFRLFAAMDAGSQIAMSTAAPASASERNLLRSGFEVAYTTLTVRRLPP